MGKPKTKGDQSKEARSASFVTVERLVADSGVTLETLEQTTARTLGLLQAVAANKAIRRKLTAVGFNAKEQRRAVDLLSLVCVIPDTDAPEVENDVVRESMNFVDDNDEEVHRVIRAAWQFSFTEQFDYVTNGLAPSTGMRAVVGMKALCERYGRLVTGESRNETRKKDREAIELLAVRGVPASRIEELAKHVKQVLDLQPEEALEEPDASELQRVRALIELRKWYLEWSEMARVVIKRRDHLISLGLASRREPAKGNAGELPMDLDPTA